MTTSPAQDIQEYLVAEGYGVSGVDLFRHKLPGDSEGVVVRSTGGFDPDKTLDKSESNSRPTVQIFIRGAKYGYDNAHSRIQEIADFLDQRHEITINSKKYISIMKMSEVLDLGENTSEKPELSVNFMMEFTGV